MLLESLNNNCLANFIYMERYVNDGSPSGFTYKNQVRKRYRPISNYKNFSLPVFNIPINEAVLVGDLGKLCFISNSTEDYLPIPFHPDIINELPYAQINQFIKRNSQPITVIPTASSRTVILDPSVHNCKQFVKLHYPKLLGRFSRGLPLYKWIAAKESNQILLGIKDQLPKKYTFFEDVVSIFVETKTLPELSFGVIYRNFPPEFHFNQGMKIVPYFSLISRDRKNPTQCSILEQLLVDRIYDSERVINDLILPLVGGYYELCTKFGMIPECNAQNIVLQFDKKWRLDKIAIRDMENIWKDLTLRKERGLNTNLASYHTICKNRDSDYYQRRSFLYDFKLGEYILKPACNIIAKSMSTSIESITKVVKESCGSIWGKMPEYFVPRNTFYFYPKTLDVSRNTYESNINPKFR